MLPYPPPHTHTHMPAHMHACTCTHTHTRMHARAHTHARMHARTAQRQAAWNRKHGRSIVCGYKMSSGLTWKSPERVYMCMVYLCGALLNVFFFFPFGGGLSVLIRNISIIVICVTWMHIIFVYRVVYVDMSTRSSQINHLNLDIVAASTWWWPPGEFVQGRWFRCLPPSYAWSTVVTPASMSVCPSLRAWRNLPPLRSSLSDPPAESCSFWWVHC